MMIGWEAQLWLRHCLEGGVLEDPAVDYLAEKVDEMDAAALLEAMGLIRKRLAEIDALEGTDDGERIRVTKDCRILLPDRFDTEIRLRPLVKTVFLLFLRHHRPARRSPGQLHPREGGEPGGGPLEVLSAGKAARLHADGQGRVAETHPAGPGPGRMGMTQNAI